MAFAQEPMSVHLLRAREAELEGVGEVPQVRILILDAQQRCGAGCCEHLLEVLSGGFPSTAIRRAAAAEFGRVRATDEPELVVLRASIAFIADEFLDRVRERRREDVLLFVACGEADRMHGLVDLLRSGVNDFCFCPFHPNELCARIQRGIDVLRNRLSPSEPLDGAAGWGIPVGRSPKFLSALAKVPAFANSHATVLLQGETGTGKELFARALHYNGVRKGGPFIPVNCGALPEQLFENELFGHTRGAYTNASSSETGLLALAERGTLFLDEVDSLSLSCQVKLLRFLQDRQYRPLGSAKAVAADVRVIAATNSPLRAKVEARVFREDLFHRLNVLTLTIPPLRERIEDIEALSRHFLSLYAREYDRGQVRLDAHALRKLISYTWPGNVRELEATLHRAIVLSDSAILLPGHLDLPAAGDEETGDRFFHHAKQEVIRHFERSYLTSILAEHRGNVSHAAHAAGKERRSFQRLLRKHNLKSETFR